MITQKQNLEEKQEEWGQVECPKCKGSGNAPVVPNPMKWERMFNNCGKCDGKGTVDWLFNITEKR